MKPHITYAFGDYLGAMRYRAKVVGPRGSAVGFASSIYLAVQRAFVAYLEQGTKP